MRVRRVVRDVGVLLVAQPLDDVHLHRERDALLALPGLDQCGVLERFGADADHHVVAVADGSLHVVGQVDRHERQAELAALDGAGDEVHRRGTDEAGDEHVHRMLVELPGRGDLLK